MGGGGSSRQTEESVGTRVAQRFWAGPFQFGEIILLHSFC